MTTARRTRRRHPAPVAIDHLAELNRVKAAIEAVRATSHKPSRAARATAPVATANTIKKGIGHRPRAVVSRRTKAPAHVSAALAANEARHKQMNRQIDDYSVFEKPGGTTWGLCGLKLSTDILTFPSRGEATTRGTALARAARVSLWYEPTSHLRDGLLVASFRDEKVR
jgi:hypothetical protein